ncbi:hypothetical protein [Pararhizobium arenae]|uniref:hypothetical protein n=1 Tax=Pararhizobium arenae TaxID=1856850 RepID=UPI000AF1F3A5|nr:hypothetical protein [Pararhizobium arenae]
MTTRKSEELAEALGPLLQPDMMVRLMKSMAFVNVQTPAINHLLDFDTVKDDVLASLHALERLWVFSMNKSVRKLILAAI